jgi:hypothetical protein
MSVVKSFRFGHSCLGFSSGSIALFLTKTIRAHRALFKIASSFNADISAGAMRLPPTVSDWALDLLDDSPIAELLAGMVHPHVAGHFQGKTLLNIGFSSQTAATSSTFPEILSVG